jgi:ligand-binding sensor domain-containing protein
MFKVLAPIYCVFLGFGAFAQNTSRNLWQEYLPYRQIQQVVKYGDVVYASTQFSLFSYDLSDNSIERISKVNRLNDFGVAAIDMNIATGKLVVGYTNGNIDFLTPNNTFGQPAIKIASLLGDKSIYHIYNEGSKVYVSTGFGIVVLDAVSTEVLDTYVIGSTGEQMKVNAVTSDADFVYAATNEGLKKAPKNSQFLASFTLWQTDNTLPNASSAQHHVLNYKNQIIVTYKPNATDPDEIYYHDGTTWNMFPHLLGEKIKSITQNGTYLVITTNEGVWVYDENFNEVKTYADLPLNYAIYDENGVFWVGSGFTVGLMKIESPTKKQFIFPSGPIDREVYALSEIIDGKFWTTGGAVTAGAGFPTFNSRGFNFYNGNGWKAYNAVFTPELNISNVTDYLKVSANPKTINHAVVSNYTAGGLFEIKDEVITRYEESNSTLKINSGNGRYNLEGVKFDKNEHVWVINSYSSTPLHVKSPDGSWRGFNFGASAATHRYANLFIDSRGFKWLVSPSGGGVIVFDDNNTPLDLSDDRFRILNSDIGRGALPTATVLSIAEDINGLIWVGTNEGPAVFFNPQNIFSPVTDTDAKQILIEQDGFVEILLGPERILSIDIDGANRKWIGTENSGVFALSEDGLQQIHHFTKDNSPLFSNTINDIRIDQELGIVYIATEDGLMSFKTDATKGATDYVDVYAYPNPVRENYEGNIYINGLVFNSTCKLTDIEGNLVAELKSLGGQAVWDGRDKFGNRVKTGVYLVFLSSPDGNKTEVTKIMVVR